MPSTPAQECRARAKACEELAETATNPTTRETLLYLARRWRDLADADEAKDERGAALKCWWRMFPDRVSAVARVDASQRLADDSMHARARRSLQAT